LWDFDQEHARVLFVRAWEAAETTDKEGRRRSEEERKRFLSGRGGTGFIPSPPNLRAEVLRLASSCDRKLAESFLAKMEEENKDEEETVNPSSNWNPTEPPEAIAKRLELARQLLEGGDVEKALLLANPALNRATTQGIMFLVTLRKKNATLADQLYKSLLKRTANDLTADATSVSLLSSYILTPSVLVTTTRSGLLMNPWTETLPPPDAPSLRAMFFRVAAQVLLRPIPLAEQDRTSAGRPGTYFTITRLLPLFEQYAPDSVALLQARLSLLTQDTPEIIPAHQRDFLNAGFTSKGTTEETLEDMLARIESVSSTNERDHLYARAARAAVMKNNSRARELADKISDAEMKKRVRAFVDFILVSKALEQKDTDKALQWARTGELSHLQRVWAYTEAAHLLKASAPERSSELMTDAMMEANRISVTNQEYAQAWVAIARRVAEVDRARLWETVIEITKAINRVPDFTGEENKISVRFQSQNNIAVADVAAPSTDLAELFKILGKEDLYLSADMARSITNESPRAIALLATARSVFEKKPKR
jgi:hypothetical protein